MSKSTIFHKRSSVTRRAIARLLGFVAIGSVCVWAGESSAMVYFVVPQGDDGASGTQERPFATIHKAAEIAQAGDEVVVRGGTYRITQEIRPRHSGTPERWIVYRAMPGEKAVIDADGFTKTGPQGVPPSRRQLGAFHLENVSYVRVENLTVRNCALRLLQCNGPEDASHRHYRLPRRPLLRARDLSAQRSRILPRYWLRGDRSERSGAPHVCRAASARSAARSDFHCLGAALRDRGEPRPRLRQRRHRL